LTRCVRAPSQADLNEEAAWKKRKEESKSAGISASGDDWCGGARRVAACNRDALATRAALALQRAAVARARALPTRGALSRCGAASQLC
jgi:hypothetical protein